MMTSAVSAVKAAPAYISHTARTTDCGASGDKLVDVPRSATGDTIALTRQRRSLVALPGAGSDWHRHRTIATHDRGICGLSCADLGGRYWDRTSDLLGVNEALSR